MTLPMGWNEWTQHDGVALAARVRKGELTARELASQANAGIAKLNPALSGVVEVFEDAIESPGTDGANLAGAFLQGALFLNCAQLVVTRNWQAAFRDDALACGAAIPPRTEVSGTTRREP